MPKLKNNNMIYVREKNLQKWDSIKNKSDFINWCLENKLNEYKEKENK